MIIILLVLFDYFKNCYYFFQICLYSRDEKTILVVSYQELKQCLEQSFCEIASVAASDDHIKAE